MWTLALFPAISATTTLAGVGEWSSPWILEYLPVIYIAGAFAILAFAIKWTFGKLHK